MMTMMIYSASARVPVVVRSHARPRFRGKQITDLLGFMTPSAPPVGSPSASPYWPRGPRGHKTMLLFTSEHKSRDDTIN